MKLIRTEEAVGHVLCHDMTQIIKDQYNENHHERYVRTNAAKHSKYEGR